MFGFFTIAKHLNLARTERRVAEQLYLHTANDWVLNRCNSYIYHVYVMLKMVKGTNRVVGKNATRTVR